MTILWVCDAEANATLEFGLSSAYGQTVTVSTTRINDQAFVYKGVIAGLQPGTTYHYRVTVDGTGTTDDRLFQTAPNTAPPFLFGVWSDSQGTNHVLGAPDPYEPTNAMMRHMVQQGVRLGVGVGDLTESGSVYSWVRMYYLDRVARYLGQSVPFFIAWGNHDGGAGAAIRKMADLPSGDRPGCTSGWGSYSFDYAGCHFICLDDDTLLDDVLVWLEQDLQSPASVNAKFTFLFTHEPPYCERWIDGNEGLRQYLVPLMLQYGVDACFSGHTHEYQRGYEDGTYLCTTGGGSWLDTAEPLTVDWPQIDLGGYTSIPGFNGGLVNEYVLMTVQNDTWFATVHAFQPDGAYIGVIDRFGPGHDLDYDGLSNIDEETLYFTDPASPDTDGDTLTDGDEVFARNGYATDPDKKDTDDDGVNDNVEIEWGTDPTNPNATPNLPAVGGSVLVLLTVVLAGAGAGIRRR